MARTPTIGTVVAQPWRVMQRPGVVFVGAVYSNDPDRIGATVVSVGLTDASITWNPNVEADELRSDQMFNPHGMVETSWGHTLSMSLDQTDIYNIALAMSYDQDAVSASSMLYLDGYQPSPYRCVQLQCETPKNVAADAQALEYLDFWKAKVIPDGGMEIGRTVKSTVPVIIHGIANSSDRVGALRVGTAIVTPTYE